MTITANAIAVEYAEHGSPRAPALVMAHSILTAHGAWDAVVEALAQDYRVIVYDLRGHGGTEAPEGPYTIDLLADDAVALLDAFELERAHFVGLSLGGMVGQVLAARHPDRVERLVLAATGPKTPPEMAEQWDERIAQVRAQGMESQVEPFLSRWFTPNVAPGARGRAADLIRATPVPGFIGAAEAVKYHDATALLGEIKAPTLVLTGSKDAAASPAIGDLLAARIKGAVHETIADSAHQIAMQRPEAFLAAVRSHLAEE